MMLAGTIIWYLTSFDFKLDYRPINAEKYCNFIQIKVKNANQLNKLSKFLSHCEENAAFRMLFTEALLYDQTVYESNVSSELRFLVDTELVGESCLQRDLPPSNLA